MEYHSLPLRLFLIQVLRIEVLPEVRAVLKDNMCRKQDLGLIPARWRKVVAMFKMFSYGEVAMPVYEYYCETCQLEYEIIRPVSKMDDPAPCANCNQNGQRQLSNFSFKSKTFSAPKLGPTTHQPFRNRNPAQHPSPNQNPSTQ